MEIKEKYNTLKERYNAFLDFIENYNIDEEQKENIINTFCQVIDSDEDLYDDFEEYMDECEEYDDYNFEDLSNELDDLVSRCLNSNVEYVEKSDDETEEKVSTDNSDLDFDDEEIEEVDKKTTKFRNFFKAARTDATKEEFNNKVENENSTVEENIINDYDSVDFDDEEIEEINSKEQKSNKKSIITWFKNLFKKEYVELPDEDIERVEEKPISKIKSFFNKIFKKQEKTVENNKKDVKTESKEVNNFKKDIKSEEKTEKKVSKYDEINDFINENGFDNEEINDFIKLANFRDDKDQIINRISNYIKTEEAKDQDKFLNKMYEIFGINNNKQEEKEQEERIEVVEPKVEEKIEIVENIKEEQKTEEEQKIEIINIYGEKYLERKEELFNELDEYEKMFVQDMLAENLNPGDIELDQMIIERNINKARIYKYLLNIEKAKIISAYENLGKYEKMLVDDMNAENIHRNDSEFNQIINERCVNKSQIKKYFDILENSMIYQNQIVMDYKKHIKPEFTNLEDKKVKELKEIAKEKSITNISKLNKTQLIEALNQLTIIKEQQADKELGLNI